MDTILTLLCSFFHPWVREAAKKSIFGGPATKRGGGGKGLATAFFEALKNTPPPKKKCGHKTQGGRSTKKTFAVSLTQPILSYHII